MSLVKTQIPVGLEPTIFRLEGERLKPFGHGTQATLSVRIELTTSRLTVERASQLRHESVWYHFMSDPRQ